MSVVICGKRSAASFFEEEYHTPVSASKKIRCSAALHFSPSVAAASPSSAVVFPIDHLKSLFPDMDQELLERALEASGNDLDVAIKNLNNLHLEPAGAEPDANSNETNVGIEADVWPSSEGTVTNTHTENPSIACNLSASGSEWVELIVQEMSKASNMEDARDRASRVLEGLQNSIVARASAETAQNLHKENVMLKEQIEKLLHENDIWKRGFKTLHGQKEEFDRSCQEMQQLRQMISQRDEQLKGLQMENYELKLRLVQEQQKTPLPGRFHPDIFG